MSAACKYKFPTAVDDFEQKFMDQMSGEGLSVETIRQRVYLLRGIGGKPWDVCGDDIIAFLNTKKMSQSTHAAYITILRSIFNDLIRLGWVDQDPMARLKTPRTPRRSPRPLPDNELELMLNLPDTFKREREWTILGAYAGLRAGEVASLPGNALRMGTHGMVLQVRGKGNLVADIPAHPKVVEILEQYSGAEPIWDMWPTSVNRAWQRAGRSVGVDGRVFHQLRHSYATRLYKVTGGSLLTVASACRHASVATTQAYAAVSDNAPFLAVIGL